MEELEKFYDIKKRKIKELEKFYDIKGYEGLYQINRLGQIKSVERYIKHSSGSKMLLKERILINAIDGEGYNQVGLRKCGKIEFKKVHSLLVKTFINEYDSKYFQIRHINKIRCDNRLENLIIVSNKSTFGVGVRPSGGKFVTKIRINKKSIPMGTYLTAEQASDKYLEVKKQIEDIEKITIDYDFKRTKIGKEYFLEFFPI